MWYDVIAHDFPTNFLMAVFGQSDSLGCVHQGRPFKLLKNNKTTMQKFFLYARKSTDVEDKQVRSIEDQIAELRAFAKQNNLNVIDTFIEKQSAKIPGRPIFGEMIKRIEKGEAQGILAWHPTVWRAILLTAEE